MLRSRVLDETRAKQNRGIGSLSDYIPWIFVHEMSSSGVSWRIKGAKTGRVHHLMSTLEKRVFLHLDSLREVIDIREQYPLVLDDTLRIADSYNISHPSTARKYVVMTSDFVIDFNDRQIVIAVKPKKKLTRRVVHKLQIEHKYWQEQGIQYFVFTEIEIGTIEKLTQSWLSR